MGFYQLPASAQGDTGLILGYVWSEDTNCLMHDVISVSGNSGGAKRSESTSSLLSLSLETPNLVIELSFPMLPHWGSSSPSSSPVPEIRMLSSLMSCFQVLSLKT